MKLPQSDVFEAIEVRTLIALITGFFLFVLQLGAQPGLSNETILPPSPNAASLVKFAGSEVSYTKGQVVSTTPIHTLEQGKLSLDVNLSYSRLGDQVHEIASQVGLGWSLQAGGLITRTIAGRPDETTSIGYHNIVFDPGDPNHPPNAYLNRWDLAPDVYSFNFYGSMVR